MKKYILAFLGGLSLFILTPANAQCPVCTIAVIGGVGLARWLKIDDSITGLWVGGLLVSVSLWTLNWLHSKKWNFWMQEALIPIFYYATAIIPLYYYNIIGHPANMLWRVDKLILGTIVGSIFFFAIYLKYEDIKKKNNGHAQFPFQKVVLPVLVLGALSLIFFLITRLK